MRVSEVLELPKSAVDLESGVLSVHGAKGRKDRLIPVAHSVLVRLQKYETFMDMRLGKRTFDAPFFPAPHGGPYKQPGLYKVFRLILQATGIPHRGRGKGPRLHDIRHTFAVHRLEGWYRQGADLAAKLPFLAAYMGHKTLAGTQRYLRLTPNVFGDIAPRLDEALEHIIPRRTRP